MFAVVRPTPVAVNRFGPGVAPARPEPRAPDDDFDRAARRFRRPMSIGRASGTTRAHVGATPFAVVRPTPVAAFFDVRHGDPLLTGLSV